ncbi:hypothetical protein A3F66_00105 [candidate division TM6 bacterium RIFCSPHIGHO2_12_FULL_32_22]|nr:MAG: hypothetical protein A3F66_00105 [candidate division TM6 bacterium RIFCSPHIGHO2_12_FULL_32_22]
MKKILILLTFFTYNFSSIFLAMVENNTSDGNYRYYGKDAQQASFLVTPLSSKTALNFTEITTDNFALNDVKGNNPSIYMKLGLGIASGSCQKDKELPGFIELWTDNPSEFDCNKVFVRFCLTENQGYFGLKVKADGTPELFAIKGMKFLEDEVKSESTEQLINKEGEELQAAGIKPSEVTAIG